MVGWAVIPSGRATGGGDDSSPGWGCGSLLMELRRASLKADAGLQGRMRRGAVAQVGQDARGPEGDDRYKRIGYGVHIHFFGVLKVI